MPVYPVYAANPDGSGKTGLTPAWSGYYRVSDGMSVSPPVFTEIGSGWYSFSVDPGNGACGTIDFGAGMGSGSRYLRVNISQFDLSILPFLSDRG